MRVGVVGCGYVGLVTAACLAESGNHVVAVDIDPEKVRRLSAGESTIFEPGLEELLHDNLHAERLVFTTDATAAVRDAEIMFLAVGTPPREDGSADLSHLEAAAKTVASAAPRPLVMVIKSTVPVGTGQRIEQLVSEISQHRIDLVSCPEFLKEGTAVDDFLRPDRVVVGSECDDAAALVAELHQPFVRNNHPILHVSRRSAEMIKYASNSYLATRISFINEIATLCGKLDVDINEVRRGMGADARIGHHYLYPGVGYGGSCFPKDVQALISMGREIGMDCAINAAVHARNLAQRTEFAARIVARFGGDLAGKTIAVWGLAFKPKTDDLREAPALDVVSALLDAGAKVRVHDPKALELTRAIFGERIAYCDDAYEALDGASALVIATEWMEYRSPDFEDARKRMAEPVIFDGRNLFGLPQMRRLQFEYHSIGRPTVKPGA